MIPHIPVKDMGIMPLFLWADQQRPFGRYIKQLKSFDRCIGNKNCMGGISLANYLCSVRTNYFHVKNPDLFRKFMERVYGTEDSVELWERKDGQGLPIFGFGSYGAIGGVRNTAEDTESEADETDYDEFVSELQQHVREDDAVIILEAGSEKLRYIVGSVEIITSTDWDHLDIADLAKRRAAVLLNNPTWHTTCEY